VKGKNELGKLADSIQKKEDKKMQDKINS